MPSLLRLGTLAIAAGMALVAMNGLRPDPRLTSADIFFALGAVLLLAAFLRDRRTPVAVPAWLLVASGALIASGLLVELFPPPDSAVILERRLSYQEVIDEDASNLNVLGRFTAAILLTPVLIGMASTGERGLRLLIDLWLVGVAVSCVVAGVDFLGGSLNETLTGADHSVFLNGEPIRFSGLAIHPSGLALQAAMALPVALWATVGASGRARAPYAVAIGLFAVGVLVSGSRAGLLGAVLAVVLFLALQPNLRRWAIIAVAVAVVLVPLAAVAGLEGADRLLGGGTAALSDERRTLGYEQAFEDISNRPLAGYGFEFVRSAHNIYLQLLQAGGPLALVGFLVFLWGALGLSARLARNNLATADERVLASALAISIGVWLFHGLFQNSIFDRYLYVPVGLLLGLQLVVRARVGTAEPTRSTR